MARARVCHASRLLTLITPLLLLPATALAQAPGVGISGAPSFASRNSTYAITVTSTAAAFTTATFSLTASFPDVTFSETGWTVSCSFTACGSTRTITVFTGNTGGANVTVTARGQHGGFLATASANTWVRGSSTFVPQASSQPPGSIRTINLLLQTAPPLGVTFQLALSGPAAAGSSVPPTVSIAPGSQNVAFTLTAGNTPGDLTISATTGSLFYAPPASAVVTVIAPDAAPTPAGMSVTVSPPVPAGGVAVMTTFEQVTVAGLTRITLVPSPVPAPSGFDVPGAPLYFALSTSAIVSGSITVCASYAGAVTSDATELRLFRVVPPEPWVDVTHSINTSTQRICAVITGAMPSGSPVQWAIFGLNTAPEAGAITGPAGPVAAGETQQFSATFSDVDVADVHTGTWVWGDGTTSPAVIDKTGGTWTATGEHAFAEGVHQIRLVISDGGQSAASPDFGVTADGSAPVIAGVSATPGSIWPPNSKMHDVVLTVSATDDTGTPVCIVTGVSATAQNVRQTGFRITGQLSVQLKAFPHAVYAISITCRDAIGRTATRTVTVAVQK